MAETPSPRQAAAVVACVAVAKGPFKYTCATSLLSCPTIVAVEAACPAEGV